MSVDSIDTRSLRKEALTMLQTGEAIDKTLKWTMRTKIKSGPYAKISLNIDPPSTPDQIVYVADSAPASPNSAGRRSPLRSPSFERTTSFTQSGFSRSEAPNKVSVDAQASTVTLKGKTVPVDYVKDAMVDLVRKENVVIRTSPLKGGKSRSQLEITDDTSFDSRALFFDTLSSANATASKQQPQFMRTTQAKQVAKLADPREEANLKWKKMKKQRDERNASIERRKNRDAMMYNFTRVVLNTEQAEFHRAYRDQYMQREYAVQRQHQERTEDRRRLDERMEEQLTTKRRQQQTEGKFMRTMLRESANKARAAIWEEVSINRMNNELNGTVSRSQSCLDVSSSSKVHIPEQLKNKMKTARSVESFEAAKKQIKDYYEAAMSGRIAEYTRTRNAAIGQASVTDTRLTLSPLRGSDLFQDSFTTQDFDAFNLKQFVASRSMSRTPSRPSETPNDFTSIKPMTPSPPRPDTGDFALKEYFASRMVQEELFDLENFSLNSADDAGGLHEIS